MGGMQRVATELYEALEKHEETEILPVVLRSTWRWNHYVVGPFMAKALWKIKRLVEQQDIDIVLFSSMVTATLTFALQNTFTRNNTIAAAIVHGRDVTLSFAPYQRFIPKVFNALDAVLPVSRATGNACVTRGLCPKKLYVVPNGVVTDRFAPLSDRMTMRRDLVEALGNNSRPLPDTALLLCSVGRQVKRKGFAWFVEHVMPLLPNDVHYWLAGDGPESDNIRLAAQRRGLSDRVRLLGRISDYELEILYRGADLFIMPNIPVPGDMEGFGVVMLEAGLCGLPTVASRLEGIMDVIVEEQNGHLIESGNAWVFSEAIMQYHNNLSKLVDATRRTVRYVADRYSWHAVADQYVQIIQSVAMPPKPRTVPILSPEV